MEPWAIVMLVWWYHQIISGFLVNGNLHELSRLSASFKDDNEEKSGAVYTIPKIYFLAEETPGKPQLGDRLMKAVLPVISLIGVPSLQMTSVGFKGARKRKMKGWAKREIQRSSWVYLLIVRNGYVKNRFRCTNRICMRNFIVCTIYLILIHTDQI